MLGIQTDEKLDYRFVLLKEFESRQQRNSAYSLRAFARTLGVSAAYLSQVFSKKRNLSEVAGKRFSQRLGWSAHRRKLFMSLIQYQRAPEGEARELILSKIDDLSELDFLELEADQFKVVAEWYHFAIVELVEVQGFEPNTRWIATRLGIPKRHAQDAIARLLRVGLLKESGGRLGRVKSIYRIQDVPSDAIRHFHHHHLKLAADALRQHPYELRDLSGTTVAVNIKDLPVIKTMIRDFRNKLNRYCTDRASANAIYHLAIQFYRLDARSK